MFEAQKRDAVKRCKFWFRKDIVSSSSPSEATACVEAVGCCYQNCTSKPETSIDESCVLMSINEIINGKENQFPGIVPLLRQYLNSIEIDATTHCTVLKYLRLIADRASGKLLTTAQWIRNFVLNHPNYNHDSVVNDIINYDLLVIANKIQKGEESVAELLGEKTNTETNNKTQEIITNQNNY